MSKTMQGSRSGRANEEPLMSSKPDSHQEEPKGSGVLLLPGQCGGTECEVSSDRSEEKEAGHSVQNVKE